MQTIIEKGVTNDCDVTDNELWCALITQVKHIEQFQGSKVSIIYYNMNEQSIPH